MLEVLPCQGSAATENDDSTEKSDATANETETTNNLSTLRLVNFGGREGK